MTVPPLWGALVIFTLCPLLGGLPLTAWAIRLLSGRRLRQLGTGNIGVSAAFYHGGTAAGIAAVVLEAAKGIAAVELARYLFPANSTWQLIALFALVLGRFCFGQGAGSTNVVWGCVAYDWTVALITFIIGSIGFTLVRERQRGRLGALMLLPLIVYLQRQSMAQTLAAIAISTLLALIYRQIPDDLDLKASTAQPESQQMFKFFRGDRAILNLEQPLDPQKVGQKSATLAQLKRWGYPVPMGWVLPAGDDPEPLIESLDPSPTAPLVVRSSAVGEDSQQASAAGQYQTILNVTSRSALLKAITECQAFYNQPNALQYRLDKGIPEAQGLAVLVQRQIRGVFSGVAFSRDPLQGGLDAVAIEALPGPASRVVSGKANPESYQILFPPLSNGDSPTAEDLVVEGEIGDLPPGLIRQVALLVRDLEARYHGIPQDLEWTYDGQQLWVLQSRPITTLLPIWTRKIAAEVIPGVIHPLTWSINRPLTCGVWGQLFTLVLGKQAQGLDFLETATLHYARAYFNASLLGQIFRRMGLPPESLEFLTRGAKMSKPPLRSTLATLPGLLRLLRRELRLEQDFRRVQQQVFVPLLQELTATPASHLEARELLLRLQNLLQALEVATYYSILAPLSAALRQAMLGVPDAQLDTSHSPEAASLRALQAIASSGRELLGDLQDYGAEQLFLQLAQHPGGQSILTQLERFLERYGYMSPVATDIAVPTWREQPEPIRELFRQYLWEPAPLPLSTAKAGGFKVQKVQQRLNLKGEVSAIYSQILAHLRWSLVALERRWLSAGILTTPGDIFFLEYPELHLALENPKESLIDRFGQLIAQRRQQLDQDRELSRVPSVVYGQAPPPPSLSLSTRSAVTRLQGIGASPGQVEGQIKVVRSFQQLDRVTRQTILVVPYTDAGWAPLLARAGGLIAEVGGRLSHGAIIAREYGIPAVMEVDHATEQLRDGQWVRIDGQRGIVEVLTTG
jgi:pyruvate, water dikinase